MRAIPSHSNRPGKPPIANTNGVFQFGNVSLALGDNPLTVQTSTGPQRGTFSPGCYPAAGARRGGCRRAMESDHAKAIANDASIPEFAARALAMESLAGIRCGQCDRRHPGISPQCSGSCRIRRQCAVARRPTMSLAALYPGQTAAFDALLLNRWRLFQMGREKSPASRWGANRRRGNRRIARQ